MWNASARTPGRGWVRCTDNTPAGARGENDSRIGFGSCDPSSSPSDSRRSRNIGLSMASEARQVPSGSACGARPRRTRARVTKRSVSSALPSARRVASHSGATSSGFRVRCANTVRERFSFFSAVAPAIQLLIAAGLTMLGIELATPVVI